MISVNISTIKQYFWYFDNFNKTYKIGDLYILPVLKMKEKYYIFHNKDFSLFDELTLNEKNFVPYDKQYSYKVIDEITPEKTTVTEFENHVCVFITVDDALKWTIEKNGLLNGNAFYEKSIADNDLIQFNFVMKKKVSKESICDSFIQCKNNSLLHGISIEIPTDHDIQQKQPKTSEVRELTKSEYEETYAPPIQDPLWDDFVIIDNEHDMY